MQTLTERGYRKSQIVAEYAGLTVSNRGVEAAWRKVGQLRKTMPMDYYAPIGHVYKDWTVEELRWQTEETVTNLAGEVRPLGIHFKTCVVEWIKIDKDDCIPCAVDGCSAQAVLYSGLSRPLRGVCRAHSDQL